MNARVYNPAPAEVFAQDNGIVYKLEASRVTEIPVRAAERFCGRNNSGGSLSSMGVRLLLDPREMVADKPRFEEAAAKTGVSIADYCAVANAVIVEQAQAAFAAYELTKNPPAEE